MFNLKRKLLYSSFAEQCVVKLKLLLDKLHATYDLDGYEDWFYDDSTGLLTLSKGDKEINFKYFHVGSFSEKSNTWMWAWNKDHKSESAKKQSDVVKQFGEQKGFDKLVSGHFKSNEIEAWELAAISLTISGGIGVYRPFNDDGLKIFLVLTEFVDKETAQKIKDKYISCTIHGSGRIAFVCNHLSKETKVGFEEAFDTFQGMELDEDDDLQAWCDKCEVVRQKENGWNYTSMAFAQIKLVCEECYFEMKEINLGYR